MCDSPFVLTPQAVWIACNLTYGDPYNDDYTFQYRKRYGLHAIGEFVSSELFDPNSFNTASGMDCMQCAMLAVFGKRARRFNTASGMDCMQFQRDEEFFCSVSVSIPQAVWIACNDYDPVYDRLSIVVSIPQAVWIACNTVPHSPWDS